MKKPGPLLVFEIAIALVSWFALALQLYILIANGPANGMTVLQAIGRFLIFFTILCNLFVAVSMTSVSLFPNSSMGRLFSRPYIVAAIAVYIFVVGLVYNTVLRNLWNPTGLPKLADELLHVGVPLLFVTYWLLTIRRSLLKWQYAIQWLAFPLAYVIYALIRGHTEGFYAYPFLDLSKLSGTQVLLNCVMVTAAFLVVGYSFIGLNRWLARR